MKQRSILPLFLILAAMFVLAGVNMAEAAVDVGVGIGVGGGRHYHHGGVGVGLGFTTGDPGYNEWYPNEIVAPVVYADPVYVEPVPYVYATPSIDVGVGFGGWYGGGGGGYRGGHGGGGHYGSAGRSSGGRSSGGHSGGHR